MACRGACLAIEGDAHGRAGCCCILQGGRQDGLPVRQHRATEPTRHLFPAPAWTPQNLSFQNLAKVWIG